MKAITSINMLHSMMYGAVILCAFWLRMEGARISYPAQGDASHFIQHGVKWAVTGTPISGYWSLAPQCIAGLAYRAGYDPSLVLQATTVGFGVVLVIAAMMLGGTMGLSPHLRALVGLVIAANPALLYSSTGGLSETPLIALLLLAFACFEAGFAGGRLMWVVIGGVSISMAMYYRPFEAMIGLLAYGAHVCLLHWWGKRRMHVWLVVAAIATFIAGATPFFVASAQLNTLSAGKSKLVNFAYRDDGLDSKAMRSIYGPEKVNNRLAHEIDLLQDMGTIGYLWERKTDIARKIPYNMLQATRYLNHHVFGGAFGMGLLVFLLFSIWVLRPVFTPAGWHVIALPLLYIGLIVGCLSLSFVHPRWIYQLVPLYILTLASGAARWFDRAGPVKWIAVSIMLVYSYKTGILALDQLRDRWVERNVIPVGQDLRNMVADEDMLMGFGPELAVQTKPDNPWHYKEMPFGTIEGIEAYARKRNVDWIVLSTHNHAHYPVHQVYRDPAMKPSNWELVKQFEFEQQTRWGDDKEFFYVYRRHNGK